MSDNHLYRIEQLEQGSKEMRQDIKQILNNHLPHINAEIVRVSTLVKVYGLLVLSGITALIMLGLTP